MKARAVIGPHHHLAAITRAARIGLDGGRAADEHLLGVGDGGVGAMQVATEQRFATAGAARDIHRRIEIERELRGARRDLPTLATRARGRHLTALLEARLGTRTHIDAAALPAARIGAQGAAVFNFRAAQRNPAAVISGARGRRVQGAGIQHRRGRPVTDQQYLAAALVDATSLDHTGIIDGPVEYAGHRACADQNLAAIGIDLTAVGDLICKLGGIIDDRLVDLETQ